MPELGEPLSRRELEVLQCVADGSSNKEIAVSLAISQNTVKVHLRNIFTKLGVSSRTEAMTAAIQKGVVVLPVGGQVVLEASEQPLSESSIRGEAVSSAEEAAQQRGQTMVTSDPGLVTKGVTSIGQDTLPSGRGLHSLRNAALLISLLLSVVMMAILGSQMINGDPEITPEPFEQVPMGETGWFENRPMPVGQANMATVAVGLSVYQIGGETEDSVVDTVHVYDTTNHVWLSASSKPTAVADVTAAVLFGEIYVPGGRLKNGRPTDIVEAYSPANDRWRLVTALPHPVSAGLALSDGSFLYFFGGWDGERYLDSAFIYDVGADSWRPLPAMTDTRAFATGSFVTGQLYVVGGSDGKSDLSSCEHFDPTALQWSGCPDMLLPRAGAGSAVVLNKLYVIGGGSSASDAISFSEVYDPGSETWQVVNTPMLSQVPSWAYLGVTNVEVRIYAFGGRRDGDLSTANFVYAPRVYRSFIPAATTGDGN
jgi:DNA-binding CsgD family transcriptional regulator/N-acetylneuraminic acid mutarotase